ncbi:MAG: hypothetical protein HKN76_19110 [Saprospiraceae bacterium]|nr:hypothetical protein [Saprospiraceae bacterium]
MYSCSSDEVIWTNTTSRPTSIPAIEIAKELLQLNAIEGMWYWNGAPFSGYAIDKYPNHILSERTGFLLGKKEGVSKKWHVDGTLKKQAIYRANRLHGIVSVWSPGPENTLVSESNFVEGVRHGLQRRWYTSGQIQRSVHLNMGLEEGLQQAWLENGKIYVNYEAKNGRTFGLKKANLCYELENENILFTDK